MANLGIGQLAKDAGVAIDTVRYYERSGLLAPAGRLASGYRRYGETELRRLRFVRGAKSLGSRSRASARCSRSAPSAAFAKIKRAAESKLGDIERRVAELERIRTGLRTLIAACPGHARADACPILNALTNEDPA